MTEGNGGERPNLKTIYKYIKIHLLYIVEDKIWHLAVTKKFLPPQEVFDNLQIREQEQLPLIIGCNLVFMLMFTLFWNCNCRCYRA